MIIIKLINWFFPNRVYLIRTGIAKGLYGTGGFKFIPRLRNRTREELFLAKLNIKNKIVFDIGANIGLFSLFFAKSVHPNGQIFSFEPNPIVYKELLRNLAVNNFSNIRTFQLAVGSSNYKDKLVFPLSNKGTGTLNKNIQADITSRNSLDIVTAEIEVVSLDNFIFNEELSLPDFIKIDVEGFEFDVLNGMKNILRNKKPELYIEIHGVPLEEKEDNIINIVNLLNKYNYNIKLVETNEFINLNNAKKAREGHIYCF